jgi:hypothetical protein
MVPATEVRDLTVVVPFFVTLADGTERLQMRLEMRTRTVTVFELQAQGETLAKFERPRFITPRERLGIQFRIEQEGIAVVQSVAPGSAATRAVDEHGNSRPLQRGDRIVLINRQQPNDVDQFVTEVTEGPTEIDLWLEGGPSGLTNLRVSLIGDVRELGVRARACEKGLHIVEGLPGVARVRLFDDDGNAFELEAEDHIIPTDELDQMAQSVSGFAESIFYGPRPIKLRVLDKDGRTVRDLWLR